ncbi:MAG: alpha-glucan family phosphorylase [Planctomycetota bacterium]|jgi:starch phosphorylase
MKIRKFHVAPRIPERIAHLKDLAMNLWFCWNWEAVRLFIRLDHRLWEECYQNPVEMLGKLPQSTFEEAAADDSFVAELERVYEHFREYMKRQAWFQRTHGDVKGSLTAYFSAEYGIDEGLPIYSGGLGILSGDHLKSSSDLGFPLVGMGLLYQKGYFRQRLNLDGWQQEDYPINDWYNMPVTVECNAEGSPLEVSVEIAGTNVRIQIWRVQVGRTPLYLLDTNMSFNQVPYRDITDQLYAADREMRLMQEIVLGIAGVRALEALGLKPTVYHANEGHSAFMALERIRRLVQEEGLSFTEAREVVRASTVFTTHTPVPAGNEVFDLALVEKHLKPMSKQMGISWEQFAAMGDNGEDKEGKQTTFSMPALALRLSAFANGVSELHGRVSRGMWHGLWPDLLEDEVPIASVTNGVHNRSWISHDLGEMLDRYLGPKFMDNPEDRHIWENVEEIPDGEVWRVHEARRERLVFFVRKRLRQQLRRQGAGSIAVKMAEEVLRGDVLTVGFARRFATYKRANLLLRDADRLKRILTNTERPVQLLFAGKAHPADNEGKELIKSIVHFTRKGDLRNRVVFIEDYDINVARYLVQGVDVWLNTPVRPLEASGTSGMKAATNCVLNLSVLDGWWAEGCYPRVGWSIGSGEEYADAAERDRIESEALYTILEREVVPTFYERDRTGIPREWVRMMKACLKSLAWAFSSNRMVREYAERAYLPAHKSGVSLVSDSFAGARELASWRARVAEGWPNVRFSIESAMPKETVTVGDKIPVSVLASLGDLSPDDVQVEVVYGVTDTRGNIQAPHSIQMQQTGHDDGWHNFAAEIVCDRSGRYGFAVRVVTRNDGVSPIFASDLVRWET